MPQNIANYYQLSTGAQFLIMGDTQFVAVYDRKNSPWKRLNGEPIGISDLKRSLDSILEDPNTKGKIIPQYQRLFVGSADDVVMIEIKNYEEFWQNAQKHLY